MKTFFRLLLLMFGLNHGISCFAQSDMYDPASVPTPNQSSLGLFGAIPVSHYTGTADVSIPLYATSQRGVDLNISLCYNTSGLLMNQLPGWTGHNWTLMAGGAITRKINGRPDEIDLKGTKVGLDLYTWYTTSLTNTTPVAIINQKEESYTNYFTNAVDSLANLTGSVDFSKINAFDSAADIFFFNFMGISGKFFFGGDGNWKVVCDRNINVIFDVKDKSNYMESFQQYYACKNSRWTETWIEQPKTIKGFTLVDEDGTQYIFGGEKNYIEYSIPLVAADAYCNTTQPWNAVSWMLKEVRDRFGNLLYTFDYSRGGSIAQIQHAYNVIKSTYTPSSGTVTNGKDTTSTSPRGTLNAPLYLDRIHIQDGTDITFSHTKIHLNSLYSDIDVLEMLKAEYPALKYEYKQRSIYDYSPNYILECFYTGDYGDGGISSKIEATKNNLEVLNSITINNERNSDSYHSKKFCFLYSLENRMHLTSVILDENTKYFFEYEGFDQLPTDYLTKQIDNWGYYNGIDYDQSRSFQTTDNGNRDYVGMAEYSMTNGVKEPRLPDIVYGKLGMLKRIYYPTGGYTQFEYEQNTCNRYMSEDKQSYTTINNSIPVGGLRIKSLSDYDGDRLIGRKTYEYSNGELYSIPNSRYVWDFHAAGDRFHYVADMICSVIPLSNSFSSTLGYSQVTEKNEDGSYTIYRYSNFSSEKDDPCITMVPGQQQTSPYDETCSRQYMCGKLTCEEKYDSGNNLYQKTEYEYDSDIQFNQEKSVLTTSLCRMYPLAGTAGSVYKLYYFKSGLKKKKVLTKYGTGMVTDEYTYEREHTPLTITLPNGKSHVTDVFKIVSETVSRGNNNSKTVYSYPFKESGVTHQLVNQFCLPVTCKRQYVNNTMVGGEKVVFNTFNGKILPQYIYQIDDNDSLTKTYREYCEYDSKCRAKRYIDENGISHYLIWNQYGQLTANIANSSGSGISASGTISGMQSYNKSTLFTTKPILANLYEYDEQGRLAATMVANSQRTDYTYDKMDRLTKVDWNNKKKAEYQYYQNNNASLHSQFGFYTSNYLHVETSNPGKAGCIRVDYKLKYNVSNAEIKMIYVNGGNVVAQEALGSVNKVGKVWFPIDPSWRGPYKICLYDNGKYVEEADTRLYY